MMFRYTYVFRIKKKSNTKGYLFENEHLSVHNSANFRVVEIDSSDSGIGIINVVTWYHVTFCRVYSI